VSPDRLPQAVRASRSCDHPRNEKNDLMRPIVTGVTDGLVEEVSGRARGGGRPGLAGVPIPGETGSHEATPSGAVTT
jgi:hypothetical protein